MKTIKEFVAWLYNDDFVIIKCLNDHNFEEYSKETILESYQTHIDGNTETLGEELLLQGLILCDCNCITAIPKEKHKDNKIQCLYCGKYHTIGE